MAPTPEEKDDILNSLDDFNTETNSELNQETEESFDFENVDFDASAEQDTSSTIPSIEEDFLLDNDFDLSLEEDIPLFDDAPLHNEEELDITKDLGLQENLSIEKEQELSPDSLLNLEDEFPSDDIENIDLNLLDQEIELNMDDDDEYCGVALKEGPETIVTLDKTISPNIVDDIVEQETDENIINFSFPEKKQTAVNPEEEDYLKTEMNDKEIDTKELINESLASFKHNDVFVSDEELLSLGLESSSGQKEQMETTITDDEILIAETPAQETEEEDPFSTSSILDLENSEEENAELNLDTFDEMDLQLEDNAVSEIDEIAEEKIDVSDPSTEEEMNFNALGEAFPDEHLDEELREDFTQTEEELSDFDLQTSPLEEDYAEDFDLDFEGLIEEEEEKEETDDEKIAIDSSEIERIEDDFFPSDHDMPAIEESVSTDIDNPSDNTILPLDDAETVFSISDDDFSEEVSDLAAHQTTEEEEEDAISLSSDELDNILKTTDFVEDETETIDIDNLDANLIETESVEKQEDSFDPDETVTQEEDSEITIAEDTSDIKQLSITPDEEEEIYSSLKSEMQEKETETAVENVELLKKDVRTVLSYLDQLLDALPEEKIKEFAQSNEFDVYRKLFEELNIQSK